ncbi:FHIPEP family type III secretion protein, partial [Shigella flexneri]|uniref:FHIPEP family type III secretion protein n=1 Tax=Shigella flexneri TaxID=623 RepID=UPI001305A65C
SETSISIFKKEPPEVSDEVMETLAHALRELRNAKKNFVLLVSVDIRRFVKRLIDNRFKSILVISYAEIDEAYTINVLKTI